MAKKVSNLIIALQNTSDRQVYIQWEFSASHTDHFHVQWYYTTGNSIKFDDGSEDIALGLGSVSRRAVHTPPSHAIMVCAKVKPVSTTHTVNGKETSYWTGEWSDLVHYRYSSAPPETPSAPSVSVDQYTMTATLDNITDSNTDQVEFYVVKGNSKFTSGIVDKKTNRASFSCTLKSGYKYRARCRGINLNNGKEGSKDLEYWANDEDSINGDWGPYSDEVTTVPEAVTNVKCSAESGTEAKVSWTGNSEATEYVVEYATNKNYFDKSSNVSSVSVTGTAAYISGLETGQEWFFRVKASNSQGDSAWSSVVSTILGTKPAAPTTWSSTTTAMVGEDVRLYWIHNSQDGSTQQGAQVEITINNASSSSIYTITGDTAVYTLSLSGYTDGANVKWRVRTKGITDEYGDWSIQRTIDIYAPATLSCVVGSETLTSFPLVINLEAGPSTQNAVTYFVSIIALNNYETVDETGQTVRVNSGEEVYSKNYNVTDTTLKIELSAGDLTLANGQKYRAYAIVSMSTGMTAEAYDTFSVSWDDALYDPDAGIGFDFSSYTAYITPACYYEDTDDLIDDVVLSVYRREYDGKLTELATELPNDGIITITDPHPSLDYARYRIVARGKNTSVIGYSDLPGYPVNEPSIIIQWDEDWTSFDFDEEASAEEPPWTGSLLKLPGNVDVSESHDIDVELLDYIGREHPVSYYGTQKGEGGSWSTEIPKKDNEETIYSLRRLSNYTGDVYVREPSGIGYWAQIAVSMSQTHCETVIPVSFEIKRVEGGA